MVWFDDLKTPGIKTQVNERTSKVPEGLWVKCNDCGEFLQSKVLKQNSKVCPECSYHFRMTAIERVTLLCDTEKRTKGKSEIDNLEGVPLFVGYGEELVSTDPLVFQDLKPYRDRLRSAAESTGLGDACAVGRAQLDGVPYHLGIFEFKFMGGSMGVVVGEKITLLFENALKQRLPAVVVTSSGGARMQEGILSLMQMAKTSALISELRKEGIPFISVLTDPTTGGVAASFAMLGDIILAEPKALIGFAGPRVIQQTIRQQLPEGFQRSEFLLAHGFLDQIVDRRSLRESLKNWMLKLGRHTCRFPKTVLA